MKRLKLKFLEQPTIPDSLDPLERILHEYGQEIFDYARGYFNFIVTTTSSNDIVSDGSLYIFVPELGYDYKILSITYDDVENVTIRFYTFKTAQVQDDTVSIKNNWDLVYAKISELLSGGLANEIFSFLVNQVKLKREHKDAEDDVVENS